MASQKKVVEMIMGIKAIYPYYAKESDAKLLVNMWLGLLEEFPDDVVTVAYKKALQTCKMPPTPADVIENIKALSMANEPTDEALWSVFIQALPKVREYMHRLQYPLFGDSKSPHERIAETWEKLPDKIQQYVGSENELKRMSQYSDDDLKFEKTKFLKAMPTIQKRQEYSLMLESKSNNLMIER